MPKREEARGRAGSRPVGMLFEQVLGTPAVEKIRDAVKDKASKYGEMDRPYVVAVNLVGGNLDDHDCIDALFGTFSTYEIPGSGLRDVHERDGALRPKRNRRVSAVAFFDNVGTWNVARTNAFVIHNPYATHPIPLGRLGIPDAWVVGDRLKRHGGRPLGELLGLPPDWPSN